MATTTRNIHDDALRLWQLEARSFLDYVVTVAVPVPVSDVDQKILEVFTETYEQQVPLLQRLNSLLTRLGMTADRPSYAIYAAQYNFVRPERLAVVFTAMMGEELGAMESLLERYGDDVEILEERLLKGILEEWIASCQGSVKSVGKVLADADRERALAAGEEVEEVVEEAAGVGDEEFPWHDEALSLDERMKLADGKGLFEKLYAAMAQTDCTACGYDCEGYARAIADGEDDDLTKCAPGELETQETLEQLMGKK